MMAENQCQLHVRLMQELKELLDDDSLEAVKKQLPGQGKSFKYGVISKLKTFYDVWEELQKKGKISAGKYKPLKDIFESLDYKECVTLIEQYERELGVLAPVSPMVTRPSDDDDAAPYATNGMLSQAEAATHLSQQERCYQSGKGFLLIINQFKQGNGARQGTAQDESKLVEFFVRILRYDHQIIQDVSWSELRDRLGKLQRHLQGSGGKYKCFICVIMSHGNEKGIQMYSVPEEYVAVDSIVSVFNADQLPAFTGVPKIFFIQACRGDVAQAGVTVADDEPTCEGAMEEVEESDADYVPPTIPLDCDILVAYSTSEGYKSWRRTGRGSWYVPELCAVLREEYRQSHLLDMLTEVNRRVAAYQGQGEGRAKQMPVIHSKLTRKLFLTAAHTPPQRR